MIIPTSLTPAIGAPHAARRDLYPDGAGKLTGLSLGSATTTWLKRGSLGTTQVEYDLYAGNRVGPAEGWASARDAISAVGLLTAAHDTPAAAVLRHSGRFYGYEILANDLPGIPLYLHGRAAAGARLLDLQLTSPADPLVAVIDGPISRLPLR